MLLCPGIEKCYIVEADATGPIKVQTDGINFAGIWAHNDIIDVNQITSNDVGGTLTMYGVEAARATLMREVRAVFGAYGIGVDPRHLGLIADFMTHMVGTAHLAEHCLCELAHVKCTLQADTVFHQECLTCASVNGSSYWSAANLPCDAVVTFGLACSCCLDHALGFDAGGI